MSINSISTAKASVERTHGEIATIYNALNEVRNGIDLKGEFHTRMGCSGEPAQGLLDAVSKPYKSMVRR